MALMQTAVWRAMRHFGYFRTESNLGGSSVRLSGLFCDSSRPRTKPVVDRDPFRSPRCRSSTQGPTRASYAVRHYRTATHYRNDIYSNGDLPYSCRSSASWLSDISISLSSSELFPSWTGRERRAFLLWSIVRHAPQHGRVVRQLMSNLDFAVDGRRRRRFRFGNRVSSR